ncbi:TPA: aminotransferase class III-fold pyridoxal phosphate-dependent enzyme [Candidatus Geothermarchaeota archaeon]|nr:aminotransferase class III-fold pyridoxal phosphate-dependent enzyme [Candidatus Geothermarchaeota archaeon]HIQ13143.1 aminotransferase class III-fold pyridoxal phosphate-dependent enzyme [Thermoprotei archaeon]
MDVPYEYVRLGMGTWRFQRVWKYPLEIVGGEGAYLIGRDGKRYLDFSSQLVNVNLGYGNKNVIEAIKEQLDTLAYLGPSYALEIRASALKALESVMPSRLKKYMVSTSGAEANEDALKYIRVYKSPRYKVIARYESYHGASAGAISLTGDPRRYPLELHTNVRGTIFAPDPFCYRCPFKLEYPSCGLACADYIEYMVKREGNVAAIFMEPITGTNGVIVPPEGYYERLREIADQYNLLLAFDEVMSGWGRTGYWFGYMHWDVEPDILTTAKGATSSYVPIGITAISKEIADYFIDNFMPIGHTFAYHPISMAAMKATIEEYKRLDLIRRSRELGEYLGRRLKELMERHKSVGDVRGLGLFWAVEIVKDRGSKTPFNTREDKLSGETLMTDRIAKDMLDKGFMLMSWISHFVVAPPLIVGVEDIDRFIDAFDESLKIADDAVRG